MAPKDFIATSKPTQNDLICRYILITFDFENANFRLATWALNSPIFPGF